MFFTYLRIDPLRSRRILVDHIFKVLARRGKQCDAARLVVLLE